MTKEPPAGYAKVSTGQIIRADREMFTLMAQEMEGSLQPDAAGVFPMEKKMRELRTDPRVTMYMLPLPKGAPRESEKAAASSSTTGGTNTRPTGPGNPRPNKRPKASAKAKSLCPQELKGFSQKDEAGNPICWAFNLKSGCKNEVTNGKCKKGKHCCMKCHRTNHSLVTCRSN